jgi:hypothetical protein
MCDKPYTSSDKWTVAFISGLLFLLVASPYLYTLTNTATSTIGLVIADADGCPNLAGIIVHGIVFTILLRVLMNRKSSASTSSKDKWIVAMIGGMLFMLISSPFLYGAIDSLTSFVGVSTATSSGCPNLGGLVLHTAIFILIVRLLMR